MKIDSPIRLSDPAALDLVIGLLEAALGAIEPEKATFDVLREHRADVDAILALGKAAPAMTRGALRALEPVETVVAVSDHHEPIPAGELLIGAHPVPDVASLTAGMRLLEAARRSKGALFLVSGGGSALAEVPAPGVEFDDLSAVYRLMLELGVPITDANTVRSHLSSLKGGRLGAAVDGEITTILISDVGSRFELVASGPTLRCRTRPQEAMAVLERHALTNRVPPSILRHLEKAALPPSVDGTVLVAADVRTALNAAVAEARRREQRVRLVEEELTGEARQAVGELLQQAGHGVTLAGGETTVVVRGRGKGGRNQEAALAAALALEGTSTVFAALGTDGVDGPTDAAGALVDGDTARRIRASGIDPVAALDDNDSHTALAAAEALIRTGPTGTNVADVWVAYRPGTL